MEVFEVQPDDHAHIRHTLKQMPDYFKTTSQNTNNTKGYLSLTYSCHKPDYQLKSKQRAVCPRTRKHF